MQYINKRHIIYLHFTTEAHFLWTTARTQIKFSGEPDALTKFEAKLTDSSDDDLVQIPSDITAIPKFRD